MATGDLTTIDRAFAWVGGTPDPTIIQRLITAVSTRICAYLGYSLVSANYTKTFNGRGGHALVLPDRPVTAVASVSIDGMAIPEVTSPVTSGYAFDDKIVYLRGYYFNPGIQNVTISYTAGYLTVPNDIEQACLEWLSGVYQSQARDPAAEKLKAGDTEVDFVDVSVSTSLIPPPVLSSLQGYRRVSM